MALHASHIPLPADLRIDEARFPEELAATRAIFVEYAQGLGFDLCFQGFDEEIAGLPGRYAAPGGRVLFARRAAEVLGCVALRPLDGEACEMKRLFVRPAGRGLGLGRALADAICRIARRQGYRRMRLDTLPSMQAALAIYEAMGFVPIGPYTFNPIEGARFLELDLAAADGAPAGPASDPDAGAACV